MLSRAPERLRVYDCYTGGLRMYTGCCVGLFPRNGIIHYGLETLMAGIICFSFSLKAFANMLGG